MHSSRMRTARLRIVRGGCCDHVPGPGPRGGGGGVVTRSREGWGVVGGGSVVTRSLVHSSLPPFSDRMTNTCENITFARFATRAVKMQMNNKSIGEANFESGSRKFV